MDHILAGVRALASVLRERRATIIPRISQRLRVSLPEYYAVESAEFQSAGWDAVWVILNGAAAALDGADHGTAALPPELALETTAAARNGLPWEVLDRTYSITHQVVWEALLSMSADAGLRRAETAVVLQHVSDALFGYFDALTTLAGRLYSEARDEQVSRREKRLAEQVRKALDGVVVTDELLGYRLRQQHVAVVGWGHDPETALAVAARLLSAELISVRAAGSSFWAWLGRSDPMTAKDVAAALQPGHGTFVAHGACLPGQCGFVSSHRQAKSTASLLARRLLGDVALAAYEDFQVEAVTLTDETAARTFVEHVLGPLAEPGARNEELRDTVVAFSEAALASRAAARLLGVSERTVRYRLNHVETILGPQVRSQLPQLVVAIRVHRALSAQDSGRPVASSWISPSQGAR